MEEKEKGIKEMVMMVVGGIAWKMHCSMEFMKQVLPRLESPTTPSARGRPETEPLPQGEATLPRGLDGTSRARFVDADA